MRDPSGDHAGKPSEASLAGDRTVERPVASMVEREPSVPRTAIEPAVARRRPGDAEAAGDAKAAGLDVEVPGDGRRLDGPREVGPPVSDGATQTAPMRSVMATRTTAIAPHRGIGGILRADSGGGSGDVPDPDSITTRYAAAAARAAVGRPEDRFASGRPFGPRSCAGRMQRASRRGPHEADGALVAIWS